MLNSNRLKHMMLRFVRKGQEIRRAMSAVQTHKRSREEMPPHYDPICGFPAVKHCFLKKDTKITTSGSNLRIFGFPWVWIVVSQLNCPSLECRILDFRITGGGPFQAPVRPDDDIRPKMPASAAWLLSTDSIISMVVLFL